MLHPKERKLSRDKKNSAPSQSSTWKRNLPWVLERRRLYGHFSGVPGYLEHTSVISKIHLTNAYGMIPHKLVETTLNTYHVPERFQKLLQLPALREVQYAFHLQELPHQLAETGGGYCHWVHNLGDPVFCSNEPSRQIREVLSGCSTGKQHPTSSI